jgi:NADH:ubiquinone reductase (H+-translocating)
MKKTPKNISKVVIVGAGFGGLNTYLRAKKLFKDQKVQITLINKNNYFLFSPLLHEVATGGLGHHNVVEAVRELIANPEDFQQAEVTEIDLKKQLVKTKADLVEKDFEYDYLVLASGAETNFYGIPGAQKYSMVLKDLRDAILIRNKLISVFEKAVMMEGAAERRRAMSFAVVGGGATGVEMAAEMADLFDEMVNRYYAGQIKRAEISLNLVNRSEEILTMFEPKLSGRAHEVLKRRGVNILNNKVVVKVDESGLHLEDGGLVKAENIVWAAGVKPLIPEIKGTMEKDEGGRIKVDEKLRMKGFENVFVLGDAASFAGGFEGRALPMLAQIAVAQAKVVAKNLYATHTNTELQKFKFHSRGMLLSLGRGQALADFGFISLSGPVAWFIWRTVYFFNFASWGKRVKIGVDWFVTLFAPRDITKL